jgi:dTDP-4-dehydrorhamnose reductase
VEGCNLNGTEYTCQAWKDISISGNLTTSNGHKVSIKAGNQINVVGDQLGHPTSSLELSQMIITYLNHEWKPGIYNLTNSGSTTWANFASEILRYFPDSNCRIHEIRSEDLETTTKRPSFSVLDNSKVINSLGLSMSDWKIALKNEFPRIKEALL